MKHRKGLAVTLLLVSALSFGGCGDSRGGEDTQKRTSESIRNETAVSSEEEKGGMNGNTDGNTNGYTKGDTDGNTNGNTNGDTDGNALVDAALLKGDVTAFQDGSFQVTPVQEKDGGQTGVIAAPGMEEEGESRQVSYGKDCAFWIAKISLETGKASLETASASDVKKNTEVAVYGETGDNGEVHASKILILRYQ